MIKPLSATVRPVRKTKHRRARCFVGKSDQAKKVEELLRDLASHVNQYKIPGRAGDFFKVRTLTFLDLEFICNFMKKLVRVAGSGHARTCRLERWSMAVIKGIKGTGRIPHVPPCNCGHKQVMYLLKKIPLIAHDVLRGVAHV